VSTGGPEEKGAASLPGGRLLAEITNRIVALMREHYGRRPIKAKTYVCVLSDGFTAIERTMMEDGEPGQALEGRQPLGEPHDPDASAAAGVPRAAADVVRPERHGALHRHDRRNHPMGRAQMGLQSAAVPGGRRGRVVVAHERRRKQRHKLQPVPGP
jgi:hypothetical protein